MVSISKKQAMIGAMYYFRRFVLFYAVVFLGVLVMSGSAIGKTSPDKESFLDKATKAIHKGKLTLAQLKNLPANFSGLNIKVTGAKADASGISGHVKLLGETADFYLLASGGSGGNKTPKLHAFFGLKNFPLKKALADKKSLHQVRGVPLGYTVLVLSSIADKLQFAYQPVALRNMFRGKFSTLPTKLTLPKGVQIFSTVMVPDKGYVTSLLHRLGYSKKKIPALGSTETSAIAAWLAGTHPKKPVKFNLDAYLPRSAKLKRAFKIKRTALSLKVDEDGGLVAVTGIGHMKVNGKKLLGDVAITLEKDDKGIHHTVFRLKFDDASFSKSVKGKLKKPTLEAMLD